MTYQNLNLLNGYNDNYTGIDFPASPPVPTGEFPGGPASFVMRRSSGPVDFWDIHKV